MAESPHEIGSAMWGGLRPEDAGEPRRLTSVTPEDESAPVTGPHITRTILSLMLALFGLLMLLTGLGLLLGLGGVLAGVGVVALTIGLMLGMGES